ncbi:MAG TPA: NUDIX hydrolase [Waddliaceae bacterium]
MRYQYKNPEVLFKGKRVDVLSVEAEHPQGGVMRREVVAHPGAVVILPLLDPTTIILIRNERYVVQQTLWELPAGTLEKGEEPLRCAARELVEETGYQAGKITHLLDFFSTPGFCNEILFTYLAEELTFVGQNLDETEEIFVEKVPIAQALRMIQEGTIRDAKTICSLLYFTTFTP